MADTCGRPFFLKDVGIILLLPLLGVLTSTSCCHGKQIVLVMDETSNFTPEVVQYITSDTHGATNTSIVVFKTDQSMTSIDLLGEVKEWLAEENDTTTIVDVTSDCRVTAIATAVGILLLRSSLISCHDVFPEAINISPSLETYTGAAFSYLENFGSCLGRVVLLTEYQVDLIEFPKCYKGTAIPLLARSVGAWPLTEEQTNGTQVWLQGVAVRSSLHYICAVGSSDFLDGVSDLGWVQMLPPTFFNWVFVVTDNGSFNCSKCHATTPVFRYSDQTLGQFPLPFADRKNSAEIFYAWKAVQIAKRGLNTGRHGKLTEVHMSLQTNLTMDVHMVMENETVTEAGIWSEHSGLQKDDFIREILHDPSVIRVGITESPPFVFRNVNENGTYYTGYAVDVLDEIARRMNLNYRFIEPSDGKFGSRLPNGSWSGVIGDILSGTVDIAVGSLTVTAEREEVVDFTTPFYEFAGIEILFKKVRHEENLLFFVTVFSNPMWGAWFGVLFLTGFLLAAFDYLSPFSDRNTPASGGADAAGGKADGGGGEGGRDGGRTFNLKEGLWLVTASFTLSGPESTPRTASSRMLIAGFWFFCSIIMANYTANLAAFLTTSRLTTPINSLSDLASQSKVQYSVVGDAATMSYFERMSRIESNFYEIWKNISSNMESAGLDKSEVAVWDYPLGDTYMKIWSDMEETGMLSSSQEGLERVLAGDFALIGEAPYLQYVISQHCDLITIGKQFSTKSYAFALSQGSPLTEQVSNYILKLQSETILEKLKQMWWQTTAEGCPKEEDGEGLSFQTLGGVFLLAGVGAATGVFLCVLETSWSWLSDKRRKRSDTLPPINSRTDLVQEFDMTNRFDSITTVDDAMDVRMSGL